MTNEDKARVEEIRARESSATHAPWEWNIAPHLKRCMLQTSNDGKRYVMGFLRWGTQSAAPMFQKDHHMQRADVFSKSIPGMEHHIGYDDYIDHPDAIFIASARSDIPFLLSLLDKQREEINDLSESLQS